AWCLLLHLQNIAAAPSSCSLISDRGRALRHAELAELVGVTGLDGNEDHRAEAAFGLAQIYQFGLDRDAIAGANRLEVFPIRAAVEAAEFGAEALELHV